MTADKPAKLIEAWPHNMEAWPHNMPTVVERRVGKPHPELRTPAEIMAIFEALQPTFKIFGPDLLYSLWRQQRLNVDLLRQLLLDVWLYTDFPNGGLPGSGLENDV